MFHKSRGTSISSWLAVATIFWTLITANAVYAQFEEGQHGLGIDIHFFKPTGDFGDLHDYAYGFAIIGENKFTEHLSLASELRYHQTNAVNDSVRFEGRRAFLPLDAEFWNIGLGLKYHLGNFFVGALAGYYWGSEIKNEAGLEPTVGLQFGNLEIAGRYRVVGDNKWFGVRVGFYVFSQN